MGPLSLVLFVLAIGAARADQDECPLRPTGGASGGATPSEQPRPGDGGHRLILAGTPERYVPGSTYTLSLESAPGRPFRQFVLTVSSWRGDKEGADDPGAGADAGADAGSRRWPGSFQLFPDSAAQFSDDCINAIVHDAAEAPQRQVQVMWRAPMSNSGCVVFRAMVLESPGHWYAREGQLQQVLCELPVSTTPLPVDDDTEQECCACSEAKYKLVFQGLWTKETHPKDFPTSLWLMHFSDVLGASHEKDFRFWGEGQVATDGFRQLAEWGSVGWLERELRAKGRHLRTLFKAAGLWHPRVNANTSATFRVDKKKHLLSLASMIGPSPDWVVGVSGMDLCKKDCTWIEHAEIDLFPYDAGTDSGISYMSPNAPTVPRERMYKITPMYPEDPRAPFYDPTGKNAIKPMARLYLVRESEKAVPCDEEQNALSAENTENTEDGERPECVVDQWSPWSPCSVSCGKGLRMRFRSYQMAAKAEMLGCDRQLVSKEFCSASLPSCPGDPDEGNNVEAPGMTESNALQEENSVNALPDDACDTTPWSAWSSCSSSCGSGVQSRSRSFVNPQGLKKCPHVPNKEYQPCTGPPCEQVEYVDPACLLTEWSDWSPCSVSCGRGLMHRSRFSLASEPAARSRCEATAQLRQSRSCSIQADCGLNRSQAAEVCTQPPLPGPCRAYFERFYFEPTTRRCLPFGYGGCRGNRNNFKLREQCEDFCQPLRDGQVEIPRTTVSTPSVDAEGPVVDCQVTSWSEWSQCSALCGPGYISRHRTIIVEGRNGGLLCPTKLSERRRCNAGPCDPFS